MLSLCLVAAVLAFVILIKDGITPVETTSSELIPMDTDASLETGETTKPTKEALSIKIPGYPDQIKMAAYSKEIPINLVNPEENPCYFIFSIEIGQEEVGENGEKRFITEKQLYQSGRVGPGYSITRPISSTALPAGEYEAVIKIETRSLTDQHPMNSAAIRLTLIVE